MPTRASDRPADAAPPLLTVNFIALCLGNLLFLASLFMITPVLPLYVTSIGGSQSDVGVVVGAFTLSALILRLLVGRWLDQGWVRKRLMYSGIVIFLAATLTYPVTRSVPSLLLLRLFHGSGIATYTTTSTALIADLVPAARLGEAMGIFGMAAAVSMAFAPALGVALLGWSGFPLVFAVSAGVLILTALVTFWIDEPAAHAAKAVAWRDMFNRRAWLPFLLALCSSFAFSVVITYLPLLVEARRLGNAGLFFTVYSLVVLLVRVFAGRLSDRFGRGIMIVPGLLLLAGALGVLAITDSLAGFFLSALIFGIGFGAASPALAALAVEVVPPEERGSAIATYTAGFEVGIGFGAIALGPILQAAGFLVTFLLAALGPALGSAVYLASRRSRVTSHESRVRDDEC